MTDKTCAAPWVHLHTWPNGEVYPCCLTPMEYTIGNLNQQSLKEIWNDEPIRNIRKQMIEGKEPESCKRCFEQEYHGKNSFRDHMNKTFSNYKEKVKKTNLDGTVDEMNLLYWDFRFSNICNMRCRSCGPQLSTNWYEDTKKLWGSLPDDIPDASQQFNLWEQILPYFDKVEEIYFAGGEPLIMEEHYKILKKLEEKNRYNVLIKYNTNFSQLKYKSLDVLEVWKKFDNIEVGASIDGYGTVAEYIRKGTNWNKIYENRIRQKETAPNVKFYVNFTVSIMNSFHIIDFHHYAVQSGLIDSYDNLHINIVQFPNEMSLQVLPTNIKKELTYKYTEHINFLKRNNYFVSQQYESLISFMNSNDQSYLVSKFKDYMLKLDKIRDENFVEVLPELKELVE